MKSLPKNCLAIILALFFAGVGIDFQISSDRYTVRPGVNQEIIVTYRVDSIAQEPMETAQLQLSITTTPPRGLLARDTLDLIVIDNGCKDYVTKIMFVPIP